MTPGPEIRKPLWTPRGLELAEVLNPGYEGEPEHLGDVIVTGERLRVELADGSVLFDAPLELLAWQLILGGILAPIAAAPCPAAGGSGG